MHIRQGHLAPLLRPDLSFPCIAHNRTDWLAGRQRGTGDYSSNLTRDTGNCEHVISPYGLHENIAAFSRNRTHLFILRAAQHDTGLALP
jgi:hypothetical protein